MKKFLLIVCGGLLILLLSNLVAWLAVGRSRLDNTVVTLVMERYILGLEMGRGGGVEEVLICEGVAAADSETLARIRERARSVDVEVGSYLSTGAESIPLMGDDATYRFCARATSNNPLFALVETTDAKGRFVYRRQLYLHYFGGWWWIWEDFVIDTG